ncbi:MAG: fructose-1,6-bisphosphate aldolase, partial [Psychrobacter pacificensis]|nr:fructose-1,6-bisphosphate aldolase [Psychrobacter pacificensis]
ANNPSEFDPRKYFKASMVAMSDICTNRFEAFGSAGQAHKIRPISLEGMVDFYQ